MQGIASVPPKSSDKTEKEQEVPSRDRLAYSIQVAATVRLRACGRGKHSSKPSQLSLRTKKLESEREKLTVERAMIKEESSIPSTVTT
jgi:hypothetical protein